MIDLTTRRAGEVARVQRALAGRGSDPFAHRKLHAELRAGNPYAHGKLARMGLVYEGGAIRRGEDGAA